MKLLGWAAVAGAGLVAAGTFLVGLPMVVVVIIGSLLGNVLAPCNKLPGPFGLSDTITIDAPFTAEQRSTLRHAQESCPRLPVMAFAYLADSTSWNPNYTSGDRKGVFAVDTTRHSTIPAKSDLHDPVTNGKVAGKQLCINLETLLKAKTVPDDQVAIATLHLYLTGSQDPNVPPATFVTAVKDKTNSWAKITSYPEGALVWPTESRTVSSDFGYRGAPENGGGEFHLGVDLPGDTGTAVAAMAAGTVVANLNQPARDLVIKYTITVAGKPETFYTVYSHGDSLVKAGDTVEPGQVVYTMNCHGRCFGTHLHLELAVPESATHEMPPGDWFHRIAPGYVSTNPVTWAAEHGVQGLDGTASAFGAFCSAVMKGPPEGWKPK